jgi:high-affinity iron transporter
MTAMGAIGKRRSFSQLLLFLPLVLGALLVFFPRRGTTEGSSRELPAFAGSGNTKLGGDKLVFLLQYVGSDYRGAVADGAILDEYEYQEMSQFTRILVEEHARVAPEGSEVGGGLERLAAWVEAKEDPQKVLGLTRELVAAMTRELGLVTYPACPKIQSGRVCHRMHRCHGDSGTAEPSPKGRVPRQRRFAEGARRN